MQCLKKILKSFDEQEHRLAYFLVYSLFWLIMAWVVYHYFFNNDKSLIWNNDGWNQHFKALIYYRSYLRTIIKTILYKHQFNWGNYSFAMGYGKGFYAVLHYYVIGDPFALLFVFCPKNYFVLGYEVLILLRIYLAGISFSLLCHSVRKDRNIGKIVVSLTYCFSGYLMFAGIKHPYFVNPLIYLPLLIIGANRILKHESPLLFIFMIFIACVSNFYFFFIQVVLLIIYVMAYCISHRVGLKEIGTLLIRFISSGLIGTLMGSFVLLPVMISILRDSGTRQVFFESLYSANYYSNILATFISYFENGEWAVIGAGALCLIGVVYLFFDRRHEAHMLRGLLLLFTAFLLLPIFGLALNAFQYVSNRWDFGYVLLICFILFYEWDRLISKVKKWPYLISLLILGLGACYCFGMMKLGLSDLANKNSFMMMSVGIVFMIILVIAYKPMLRQVVLLVFACTCIGMNAFCAFSPDKMNVPQSYYSPEQVNNTTKDNEATEIRRLDSGRKFYRYSGTFPFENLGLNAGMSSTSYDWSLVNMNINKMYDAQGVTASMIHHFKSLNERTYLNALASVKYYISASNDVPYGYQKIRHVKEQANSVYRNYSYDIYKNKYALPLGYTYDSYISEKDYQHMSMADRSEAVLQGAVTHSKLDLPKTALKFSHKNLKYKMKYDHKNIKIKNGKMIVKKNHLIIDFYYHGQKRSETYLNLKGFDFTNFDLYKPPLERKKLLPSFLVMIYKSYNRNQLLSTKNFFYYTKLYSRSSNRHDFMINTGYSRYGSDHISVVIPKAGVYSFKNLKIIAQPMTHYEKYIRKLKENVLTNVVYRHHNSAQTTYDVSGNITLHKKKLLCLSIPYELGWKLYVDHHETKILPVNDMYMGVVLKPGTHAIRLVYHTPGLKAGIVISIAAALGYVLLMIRLRNRMV